MTAFFSLRTNLRRRAKPILVILITMLSMSADAFVVTYRYDFEKEGFGVMLPMQGVIVKGSHFIERYEPLYDGSSIKKLNYIVDITTKKSDESEVAYLDGLKKTINTNTSIRENLSDVKTTKNGYPYRSLKTLAGKVMRDYYFFYRRDDLVVLTFECLLTSEDELSGDISSAVEHFLWLDIQFDMPQLSVSFKLPYEMVLGHDEANKKINFSLLDKDLLGETNFWATLEFLGPIEKIDSVSVRNAFDKELKSITFKHEFKYKRLGTKFNNNHVADCYNIEFYENGKLMEMYIYQIYTPKGIIRFVHSESRKYNAKLFKYNRRLIDSIKYI
jgi:hypothetical protein